MKFAIGMKSHKRVTRVTRIIWIHTITPGEVYQYHQNLHAPFLRFAREYLKN